MNVLITGGAGFIGSHIADNLISKGYDVIVADNLVSGRKENVNPKALFYNINMGSEDFEKIFKENQIEYVFHLAAQVSVGKSFEDPKKDAEVNVVNSVRLFQLCSKYNVEKIIIASSAAIYGNPQYLPVDEGHPTHPSSFYGLSKLTMENYAKLFDTNYLILRFSNVYGKRQNSSGESGVISIFDNKMKREEKVFIDGDGEQIRDFIFVEDIARVCVKLMKSNVKNKTLNISSNTKISINKLFEEMAKIYNYNNEAIHREKRLGDIEKSVLDNSFLKLLIKDFCPTDLTKGLAKMYKG